MLEFTASSPYRHLSCVIDHDDPAEFVYCKEGLLDEARKNGWPIISMKNHFKTIFREAEHDRDTSGPSDQGDLDGKKQIPED